MKIAQQIAVRHAAATLNRGGVIVYPTEAVYGLGCLPSEAASVHRLLAIKQRPMHKGLILVAANPQQLLPWVDFLSDSQMKPILASWPGPYTWLLPAKSHVAPYLRGDHQTLAVRVSNHPIVQALCNSVDSAIVSTSANRTGCPAITQPWVVRKHFRSLADAILPGALGGQTRPSEIRDGQSGTLIRAGTS